MSSFSKHLLTSRGILILLLIQIRSLLLVVLALNNTHVCYLDQCNLNCLVSLIVLLYYNIETKNLQFVWMVLLNFWRSFLNLPVSTVFFECSPHHELSIHSYRQWFLHVISNALSLRFGRYQNIHWYEKSSCEVCTPFHDNCADRILRDTPRCSRMIK